MCLVSDDGDPSHATSNIPGIYCTSNRVYGVDDRYLHTCDVYTVDDRYGV